MLAFSYGSLTLIAKMGGPQKTPLKDVHQAKAYYIRCLIGIPACVWERFDGQLIKAILDAISMNVRQNMPSQVALSKRVCREMRQEASATSITATSALPSKDNYLAYQIHMEGEEVPQSHLRVIAGRGCNWLLTWDPRIKPPIFDTNSDEIPADTEDWNEDICTLEVCLFFFGALLVFAEFFF